MQAARTSAAIAVAKSHLRRSIIESPRDDTDLGNMPVTVAVGPLPATTVAQALASGADRAEDLRRLGLIEAAALCLQGACRVVGLDSGRP